MSNGLTSVKSMDIKEMTPVESVTICSTSSSVEIDNMKTRQSLTLSGPELELDPEPVSTTNGDSVVTIASACVASPITSTATAMVTTTSSSIPSAYVALSGTSKIVSSTINLNQEMAKVVPNNHTSLHAYANADEVNETISPIPEFLLEMMACEQGDSLRKGSCTEMIDMTPSQMQCLLDYLQSVSGSDELSQVPPSVFEKASLLVSQVLLSSGINATLNFTQLFDQWKSSAEQKSNNIFMQEVWPITLMILQAAASVPLLVMLSEEYISRSSHPPSQIVHRLFSEDCIEISISLMNKTITSNYSLYPPTTVNSSTASMSATKANLNKPSPVPSPDKRKIMEAAPTLRRSNSGNCGSGGTSILLPKKVMSEISRHVYALVRIHLLYLSGVFVLSAQRQHDRLCIIAYELAFATLRTNLSLPTSRPVNVSSVLCQSTLELMEIALAMLSRIYSHYPSCRSDILEEAYPFLSQCYTHPKNHPKVFSLPVPDISHDHLFMGSTVSNRDVITDDELLSSSPLATAGYAIVVTLFQGLVGLSDGEEVKSVTVPLSKEPTDNNTTDISSSQELDCLFKVHKNHIQDCYMAMSCFVKGLVKRCSHKETSGNYRETLNELIHEVVSFSNSAGSGHILSSGCLLLAPSCPIAPVLLNHVLAILTAEVQPALQLSSSPSPSGSVLSTSYLNFLIDVLGGVGCKLRRLVMLSHCESENEGREMKNRKFSEDIIRVIRHQVNGFKPHWDKKISFQKEELRKEEILINKRSKAVKKMKGKRTEVTADDGESNPKPLAKIGLQVGETLTVWMSLAATILDLTFEEEEDCDASTIKTDDPPAIVDDGGQAECKESNHDHIQVYAIPSLHYILSMVGWKECDIAKFFPCSHTLTSFDLRQAYVLQKLHRLLAESSESAVATIRKSSCSQAQTLETDSRRTRYSFLGAMALRRIILTHYSLWLRDAVRRGNVQLGHYVRDEMDDLIRRDSVIEREGQRISCVSSHGRNEQSSSCINNSLLSRHDSSVTASTSWSAKCYRQLCTERYIAQDSDRIIHVLVLLTSSQPSPLIRARCMKALGALVHTDATLLHLPRMEELVLERFNDVSISVREETVKLVGKFLLSRYSNNGIKHDSATKSRTVSEDLYLNGLLIRLRDKGVSVRKSVANTLREILLHQPEHPRYTELCRSLLERCWLPKEETTLKDVIQATFQQVWFSPPPATAVRAMGTPSSSGNDIKVELDGVARSNNCILLNSAPDSLTSAISMQDGVSTPSCILGFKSDTGVDRHENGSAVSDKTPGATTRETPSKQRPHYTPRLHHIEATASQIVDVIASSDCDNGIMSNEDKEHSWLVEMLRGLLHDGTDSTSQSSSGMSTLNEKQIKVRRASARNHCQQLVDCLMELLLQTEEAMQQSRDDLKGQSNLKKNFRGDRSFSEQIVAIFVTLSAFCEAHPPYVIKHLLTLLPYLKGDNQLSNKQEARVCLKLVQMLSLGFLCKLPSSTSLEVAPLKPNKRKRVVDDDATITQAQKELGSALQCAAWVSQAGDIAQDLTRISLKYGAANIIEAAIACLAQLCQYITHDPLPILSLAQKCFSTISTVASDINHHHISVIASKNCPSPQSSPESSVFSLPGSSGRYTNVSSAQLARLQRCIVVLGYICEQTSQCPILNNLPSAEAQSLTERGTFAGHLLPYTSHEEDLRVAACSLVDSRCPDTKKCTEYHPCNVSPYALARCNNGVRHEILKDFPAWSLNGACFVCILFLLHIDSEVVHSRAVQALCSVFVGSPKLMIYAESMGLVAHILQQPTINNGDSVNDSGYGDVVHEKLLLALQHVMEMEEKRLNQHAALDKMRRSGTACLVDSAVIKGEAEHSADASITGSILQHHLPLLLQFLSHSHPRLRCACLDLLGILLSHGMVHPLDVIAWLIGLQGDPEEGIRKSALHLLQIEDERHASFFDNRLLDGMEMAFTLQRLRAPGEPVVSQWLVDESGADDEGNLASESPGTMSKGKYVSIFAPLYNCCIRPSRKRRTDYVVGLLRRCDIAIHNQSVLYHDHIERVAQSVSTPTTRSPSRISRSAKGRRKIAKKNGKSVYTCFITSQVHNVEALREEQARVRRHTKTTSSPPVDVAMSSDLPESQHVQIDSCGQQSLKNKLTSAESTDLRKKKRIDLMARLPEGLGNATVASQYLPKVSASTTAKADTEVAVKSSGTFDSADEKAAEVELLDIMLQDCLDLVRFLSSSIASIPFDSCDEPLYLVYWINRHLSIEIGVSNTHMRTALRVLGCVSSYGGINTDGRSSGPHIGMEDDDDSPLELPDIIGDVVISDTSNGSDNVVEASTGSPNKRKKRTEPRNNVIAASPARLQQQGKNLEDYIIKPAVDTWLASSAPTVLNPSGSESDDDFSFQRQTQIRRTICYLFTLAFGSMSREILLRLKEYMKITYGLSDERCAAYNPLDSSSGNNSGGSNIGRFAGEVGIPAGMHFEPLAPPSEQRIPFCNNTIALFTSTLKAPSSNNVSTPLWPIIQLAANDHNRLLLLLSEGGCDFNTTSTIRSRARCRTRKSAKNESGGKKVSGKKSSGLGRKGRRGTLKRQNGLNSITEGDEFDSDCVNESDDDDEYNPTKLRRTFSNGSSDMSSSGMSTPGGSNASRSPASGRVSDRKKQKTSLFGDYVEDDTKGIGLEKEDVRDGMTSSTGNGKTAKVWHLDINAL